MATDVRNNERAPVSTRPAKAPINPAAGPYGHPFHPILVTVPIGAWICALVFDIATRVSSNGRPALVDGAYWLIGIGIIAAAVAAIFGLMDLLTIPRGTRAFTTGLVHMALNVTVLVLFVINFVLRHDDHNRLAKVTPAQLVLSIVGVVLLGASGWLGGMLTYRFGVRVADETTQAEGFDRA
jgi:uncharacterized membrane protein